MDPATFIESEVARFKRKNPKKVAGVSSKRVKKIFKSPLASDIVSRFDLPLREVADHLGVRISAVKKEARKLVCPPLVPPCPFSPSSLYTVHVFSWISIALEFPTTHVQRGL
jgi:hypothetical protein